MTSKAQCVKKIQTAVYFGHARIAKMPGPYWKILQRWYM